MLPAVDSTKATKRKVLHNIEAANLSSHVLSLALMPSLEICFPGDLFSYNGAELGSNASLIDLPSARIFATDAAKPSEHGRKQCLIVLLLTTELHGAS